MQLHFMTDCELQGMQVVAGSPAIAATSCWLHRAFTGRARLEGAGGNGRESSTDTEAETLNVTQVPGLPVQAAILRADGEDMPAQ